MSGYLVLCEYYYEYTTHETLIGCFSTKELARKAVVEDIFKLAKENCFTEYREYYRVPIVMNSSKDHLHNPDTFKICLWGDGLIKFEFEDIDEIEDDNETLVGNEIEPTHSEKVV